MGFKDKAKKSLVEIDSYALTFVFIDIKHRALLCCHLYVKCLGGCVW